MSVLIFVALGLALGAHGGEAGATFGFFVGLIFGIAFQAVQSSRKNFIKAQFDYFEKSIKNLFLRLEKLEKNQAAPIIHTEAALEPIPEELKVPEPIPSAPLEITTPLSERFIPETELQDFFANLKAQSKSVSEPLLETVAEPLVSETTQEPISSVSSTFEDRFAKTQAPAAERSGISIAGKIQNFFSGGNWVVRIGILLLIIGVAFLLKYAAENGKFPIELRLSAVALGGMLLVFLGWRLRLQRSGYAVTLQGGGISIFYLTVFAAYRIYHLLPSSLAFALLLLMVLLSAFLAVGQNARALAVIGFSGGFLAPILTSTGSGNYIALFSFYAVLNLGIFIIAWFKSWRELNILGFVFTFGIGSVWGLKYYQPEYFATTEPFLILFFLFYTANSMLFALKHRPKLKGFVDGTLVFGTPVVVFSLQYGLVKNFEHGLAISAIAFGFFYLVTAWILLKKASERMRDFVESFWAVGVIFATVAIPFALNAKWTAALWTLEGLGLVWIGLRQNRWLARLFGFALILIAGYDFKDWFKYFLEDRGPLFPVFNGFYLGCFLKSLSALLAAYFLSRDSKKIHEVERIYTPILCLWGLGWWYYGGTTELQTQLVHYKNLGGMLFFSTSLVAIEWIRRRIRSDFFQISGGILGLLFAAFVLSPQWICTLWTLYACTLIFITCRREVGKFWKVLIGSAILFLSLFWMLSSKFNLVPMEILADSIPQPKTWPVFNAAYLGYFLRSVAMLGSAYFISKTNSQSLLPDSKKIVGKVLGYAVLTVGLWQWFYGAFREIELYGFHFSVATSDDIQASVLHQQMIFAALSFLSLEFLRRSLAWRELNFYVRLFLPFLFIGLGDSFLCSPNTFARLGWLAWLLSCAVYYWSLRRWEQDLLYSKLIPLLHAAALWLWTVLCMRWAIHQVEVYIPEASTWSSILWYAIPALILVFITSLCQKIAWPFHQHRRSYLGLALFPLVIWVLLAILGINFNHSGSSAPLPYFPIFNPLDLSTAFSLLAVLWWSRQFQNAFEGSWISLAKSIAFKVLGAILFIWLNAVLIRTLHHWAGIPFDFDAMYDSFLVQTSLTIYWSLYALTIMLIGTKKNLRFVWMVGAVLLGLVVFKLLLIDLSKQETIYRIISFIGSGLLFLLIGYLSPLPPAKKKEIL